MNVRQTLCLVALTAVLLVVAGLFTRHAAQLRTSYRNSAGEATIEIHSLEVDGSAINMAYVVTIRGGPATLNLIKSDRRHTFATMTSSVVPTFRQWLREEEDRSSGEGDFSLDEGTRVNIRITSIPHKVTLRRGDRLVVATRISDDGESELDALYFQCD